MKTQTKPGERVLLKVRDLFPSAKMIYWHEDNPETGYESIEDMLEECGTGNFSIGIQLGKTLHVSQTWDEDKDEPSEPVFSEP